jgi:SAM-dependent methyltransferase
MNLDGLLIILFALFIIFICLYLLWVIIPALSGLPWIPTQTPRIRRALKLAQAAPGEIFYDLGSGDGRALILAAREFGVHATGIEISPLHCLFARVNALLQGVSHRVKIKWASYYKADFSDADIIFVYMTSREASRLRPRLENQLRPGVRVITISCEIGGWEPIKFNREELIFLYQVGAHTTHFTK